MTGSAADAQLWYKASMYWSISASAQDPDAALAFVDFLVNSPDAGEILSIERGVPGNLTVREAITPDRSEEHTSELQSRGHLVCRLLLEQKKPRHVSSRRN